MALDFVEVHYGFGRHKQYLTPHELQEFQKYTWGEWIQTFATLMWTKVSICLFLLRIPVTKWLIRPLQAALVVLVVSNVILTILWIVQCRPVAAAWDESLNGTCFSKDQLRSIVFAQASRFAVSGLRCRSSHADGPSCKVFSVISDFSFAAYPILMLWKVQIKWKTKVGLWCLMGLGVMYAMLTGLLSICPTNLSQHWRLLHSTDCAKRWRDTSGRRLMYLPII